MRLSILPALFLSTGAFAQSVQIAEEFTNATSLWSLGVDQVSIVSEIPEGTGAESTDAFLQLTAEGTESSGEQEIFFQAPFRQTEVIAASVFKATLQPDLSSVIDAESGEVRMRIGHHFYNRFADNGFPDREDSSSREGDVRMTLDMRFNSSSSAVMCLNSRNSEGRLESFDIFNDGTDHCQSFDMQPVLGETYDLELFFNVSENIMGAMINDERIEFAIPDTMTFRANSNEPFISNVTQALGDKAVLNIFAIETDTFSDDYRVNGAPDVFFNLDDEDTRILRGSGTQRPSIVNGELQMSVSSSDGSTEQSRLNILAETDYLEAQLSISSETSLETISSDRPAEALVRLSGSQYDVNADGGISVEASDIGLAWARIDLILNADMTTSAEYCFLEFTEADDPTPILDSGNVCENFETIPQLDTFYTTSIVTDREARTVTFSIDDEVIVHNIQEENIFQPGPDRQFNAVRSRIEGANGTVVGFADNIRTAPDLLFSSELTVTNQEVNGSGGGGCSISSKSSNLVNLLLLVFAVVGLAYRRKTMQSIE